MKTSELMIGDLLYLNGRPVRVDAIGFNGSISYSEKGGFGGIGIDKLSPIPITKEILVKNGLQKLNDKTFLIKNQIEIEVGTKFSEVSARYEDYDRDYNSYNNRYIEIAIIHYVHELQHLLRLIGVEKELKL